MTTKKLKQNSNRPYDEYLVQSRDYRISETFSMRDQRYAEVDQLLRGEWGYTLPGSNVVSQKPMVMNLGLAFVNDVARLSGEQSPVYRAEILSDKQKDETAGAVREVISETVWTKNRGDLLRAQQTMDMVVCGAAYTVCWVPETGDYPMFTRLDPRHCYPTIENGILKDLMVVHVMPVSVAEHMFPGLDIYKDSQAKGVGNLIEVWEYYSEGYALKVVAHLDGSKQPIKNSIKDVTSATYDIDCVPVAYSQLPTHDGAQRGMLDQLNDSLQAKNKIASLMAMYTEHKVFAPWESKGILNPKDTPGPNTVYEHDPNAPNETFMRRVQPAGSDPQLFALMNLLDLDQRGGIGYPASRQGEVGQSIASAAFVESTQGQLSSIVKTDQTHEADRREQVLYICSELERAHMDFTKPLIKAVGNKRTYTPFRDIDPRITVKVMYGAGAGMSRQNSDTRVLNLMSARLLDRGTARENIEFLRDRIDIQDKIEMENAEDSLQQLFWPDPNIPIDIKFQVKALMSKEGLNLTDAWEQIQAQMKAQAEAQAQAAQAAQPQQPQPGDPAQPQGVPSPTAADEQALALEKGQVVSEPADIELPRAPMQQVFISDR